MRGPRGLWLEATLYKALRCVNFAPEMLVLGSGSPSAHSLSVPFTPCQQAVIGVSWYEARGSPVADGKELALDGRDPDPFSSPHPLWHVSRGLHSVTLLRRHEQMSFHPR